MNLTPYNNTLWLCEPSALHRLAFAAGSIKCYSGKEVAKSRRQELARVVDLPTHVSMARPQAATPTTIRALGAGKKVAVIPVSGPIDQRQSSALMKAGGTSIDFISAAFDAMMDRPDIGAIVLHLDSPGGNVAGVQELSSKIFAARNQKPTYAIADSMACSAAYWIATSAGVMISTPGGGGGTIGSVGVFALHIDESKALEEAGYKVTAVSAGKFKTEFAPFAPLSDEARAQAQSNVDAIHANFVSDLARNRDCSPDKVRKGFGQGRVMPASDALAAGMIDRIMSMDDLISRLTGGDPGSARSMGGPSAETLRLQHEQRMRMQWIAPGAKKKRYRR